MDACPPQPEGCTPAIFRQSSKGSQLEFRIPSVVAISVFKSRIIFPVANPEFRHSQAEPHTVRETVAWATSQPFH